MLCIVLLAVMASRRPA